jgi:glycerol-3-phosphate dehydrogenase (NAD(P)+)
MQTLTPLPIAVLGAGSWGTALAMSLARNRQRVHLWDRNTRLLEHLAEARMNTRYLPGILLPEGLKVCCELSEALEGIQDILIVVPSHAFGEALKTIEPFLSEKNRLIWATKGLEPETGLFFHQVLERDLPQPLRYAVLSGPSFATEVAAGIPTAVAIATKDENFGQDLVSRFNQDNFSVALTDDIIGVQLGGVVKNVLGVAVGISDGALFGANTRAALMVQGLTEMMRLGAALGARAETLMGLAGCGDVILTCTDNQSRNRRFGLALAKGLTANEALNEIGQVVEAVHNVKQLCALSRTYSVRLPVAEQVLRIIKGEVSPKEAIQALFRP